jgi:hypothetical protein
METLQTRSVKLFTNQHEKGKFGFCPTKRKKLGQVLVKSCIVTAKPHESSNNTQARIKSVNYLQSHAMMQTNKSQDNSTVQAVDSHNTGSP